MAFHGKRGDRVRLVFAPDKPCPILENTDGTVEEVVPLRWGQDVRTRVRVRWDNGSTSTCLCPPEHLESIEPPQ